jgi:hypothetical protein
MTLYTKAADAAKVVAEKAFSLVVQLVTRPEGTTGLQVAAKAGVSRAWLYERLAAARDALQHRPPGPRPAPPQLPAPAPLLGAAQAEGVSLRNQIAALKARLANSVELTPRLLAQLELVLFDNNVPLRGVEEVLTVVAGKSKALGRSSLQLRRKGFGRTARTLIDKARGQVSKKLWCVMGDDVFLHRCPVKVIAEPRSMAILNIGRWPWHAGEDWALWLAEFEALDLFLADVGTDIVGGLRTLGVRHGADFFHEKRWWNDKVLTPVSKKEKTLREAARLSLEHAATSSGGERELFEATARGQQRQADEAEGHFFAALRATDLILSLFRPLCPDTDLLWTNADLDRTVTAARIELCPLPDWTRKRAGKHLKKHVGKYEGHRVELEHIHVPLREGTHWTWEQVLQETVRLDRLQRQLRMGDVDEGRLVVEERRARKLEMRLRRACPKFDEVRAQLQLYVQAPLRASSGVESINSRVRVMQVVHRTVSDEMLALKGFAFSLTEREEGPRKGKRPYDLLGVELGQAGKPWYDVLLDAHDQEPSNDTQTPPETSDIAA